MRESKGDALRAKGHQRACFRKKGRGKGSLRGDQKMKIFHCPVAQLKDAVPYKKRGRSAI